MIVRDKPTLVQAMRLCADAVREGGPQDVTWRAAADVRTLEQNSMMWDALTDLSRQVDWMIDGTLCKPSPEDWKEILSASLRKHQRVAAGIDGGFVILGQRTSKMSRRAFSDLLELIFAFGNDHGVVWSKGPR
jgi:hypothetical protein